MKTRPDRIVLAGGALVVVLLLGIALASWVNTRRLWDEAANVEHTQTVLATLESVLSTAKDAETGQRGFLLTGEPHYLDPYQSAAATLAARIDSSRS